MSRFDSSFRLLALTLLGGCALTSKAEPLRPRYFDPEITRAALLRPELGASLQALRLGRVDSSSYLREPIAFRTSPEELGYYETRRWTEKPERYLERELERALFGQPRFARAISGDAPTLEADLLEFSEDRTRHVARVQIDIMLHDEHSGLLERTITVERPIGKPEADGDDAREVVRAMATALRDAVAQVAEQVTQRLRVAAERNEPAVSRVEHSE